jgi:hypothetical protein
MKRSWGLWVALFNVGWYLSMRSIWSGIYGMTGVSWLAMFLFSLLVAVLLAQGAVFRIWKNKTAQIALTVLSLLISVVLGFMFYMGIGSLRFFLLAWIDVLFYVSIVWFAYVMIFVYPKTVCAKRALPRWTLFVIVLFFVVQVAFRIGVPWLTTGPAVYAVEDTYQIVWTTASKGTGSVVIDGVTYRDEFAGSLRTDSRVHKVIVPASHLDQAKQYSISTTHYLYRGPYSGVAGAEMTKTYAFRPVDDSDGIAYYTISDVHEWSKAALQAVHNVPETLDFLVMAGDIVSTIETEADLEFILETAHQATDGAIPILFARGNHDVKGEFAHLLSRYVGATEQGDFYYSFRLGSIAGVVLDLGEDHEDDWWEFYGLADFDHYRARQTAFLEDLLASGELSDPSIAYRLVVCHMPIAFLPNNGFLVSLKTEWTSLLNALDIDAVVSGHHHALWTYGPWSGIEPGDPVSSHPESTLIIGSWADANFAQFVCARRSDAEGILVKESLFGTAYTGMLAVIDFDLGEANYRYTNRLGAVLTLIDPFDGITRSEFRTPLS